MSDMLDMIDSILPPGWERDGDIYGLDFNLVCPHGRMLEQDGWHKVTAAEAEEYGEKPGTRCESPLLTMGLI